MRSPITDNPDIFFPSAIGNIKSLLLNFGLLNISFKETLSLSKFVNSIPTELDPGITEIRADSELVFLAISSDKLTILDTFTPAAGSNSLRVTTGPELIFFILP